MGKFWLFFIVALVSSKISGKTLLNAANFEFLMDDDDVNEQKIDNPNDPKNHNVKFSDILKEIGYDPQFLMKAAQKADFETLRKFKLFLRQKIAPLVSTGCIGDLIYHTDTLIDYSLANFDLSKNCAKNSIFGQQECLCANKTQNVLKENHWSIDVLDSFGKYPSGVLMLNFWLAGDYEQCMGVSIEKSGLSHKWQGRFVRVDLAAFSDFSAVNVTPFLEMIRGRDIMDLDISEILLIDIQRPHKRKCSTDVSLKVGTCFPTTCSKSDIETVVAFMVNLPQRSIGNRAICDIDVKYHDGLDITQDNGALFVLLIALAVATLVIFGSCYDYYVYREVLKASPKQIFEEKDLAAYNIQLNESREDYFDLQTTFVKIILAFSVYSNCKNLFKTEQKPGQIHCLHGVRALSLSWIILAHSYYWTVKYLENLFAAFQLTHDILNQFIINASLAVDGFYTISATLLAFLWLKETKKTDGKHALNIGRWLMMYLHRYLRLTPVYMFIMLVDIFLYRYLTDGPLWNQNGIEPNYCQNSWWTNLLYVNNFFRLDEQCMTWSWYLANDMQFFILSPPLLILLWKFEKIGVIVIFLLWLFTSFLRMVLIIASAVEYPPIVLMINDASKLALIEDFWKDIYVKPYTRCGPYLLGLLLGYLLFKINLKSNLSKKYNVLGWSLCIAVGVVTVFGLHDYSKTSEINPVWKAIYAGFGRSAWALVVCWIIFACATGSGGFVNTILSWKFWMPMSRLVYCAYLLHPIVIMYYYAGQMKPMHFGQHFHQICAFLSNLVVSFAMAIVFSLGCEIPVISLEKLLLKQAKRPRVRTFETKRHEESEKFIGMSAKN